MHAMPHPTCHLKISDAVAGQRRKELHRIVVDAVESGSRRVVLDCESLSDLDLMLVSTLLNCSTACAERGADFSVENLRDDLQLRIAALQLDGRIHMTSVHRLGEAAVS
jgi:anti-anti-sigma regulatory factor